MIEVYQRLLFEQQTPYLQWLKSQEEQDYVACDRNNSKDTNDCIEGKHISMLPFSECTQSVLSCVQRAGFPSITDLQDSEIVLFYQKDGFLEEKAPWIIAKYFENHSLEAIVYADEDALGTLQELYGENVADDAIAREYQYKDTGRYRGNPWFKPDFSPDTLEQFFYFGNVFAVRGKTLQMVKQQDMTIYDFVRTVTAQYASAGHISQVLYTNPSVKVQTAVLDVTRLNSTEYKSLGNELVSVIIPSKDNYGVLSRCLETLVQITEYAQYEIILVDNGSTEEQKMWIDAKIEQIKTLYRTKWQQNLSMTYLYQKEAFNFSKMCNQGATCAQGTYLLFLNDDMEIIEADWLSKLVTYAQKEHVGAVGAKLYYPKQTQEEAYRIQHVGITNMGIGPAHKLAGLEDKNDMYFGHNNKIYNMLAVTGACLMIRRQLFEQEQGFDELFAVAYNDVELCFRLYQKGYVNVVRNDTSLIHHESLSRGQDTTPEKQARLQAEKQRLDDKHPKLKGRDPFYSSNLVQWKKDVAYHCNVTYLYDELQDAHQMTGKEKKKLPKEHHNKWIRKVTGENRVMLQLDRVVYDGKCICIEGWAALHKRDNAYMETQLLLKQEQGELMYCFSVYKQLRYDVETLFDKHDTPRAALNGIHVMINTQTMDKGAYQIGIKITDKKSGDSFVSFTNQIAYVE